VSIHTRRSTQPVHAMAARTTGATRDAARRACAAKVRWMRMVAWEFAGWATDGGQWTADSVRDQSNSSPLKVDAR
jgi:hypothetical protein